MPLSNLDGVKVCEVVIKRMSEKEADALAVYLDQRHIAFTLIERTEYEEIEPSGLGSRPRAENPLNGEYVAEQRKKRLMSRGDLAKLMGVSIEHIRLLETNTRKPSARLDMKLRSWIEHGTKED